MTEKFAEIIAMLDDRLAQNREEHARLMQARSQLDGDCSRQDETAVGEIKPPRKPRGQVKPKREPSWDDAKHQTKPRLSDLMVEVLREEEGALTRTEIIERVKALYEKRWQKISLRGLAAGIGNALRSSRFVDLGDDVWGLGVSAC